MYLYVHSSFFHGKNVFQAEMAHSEDTDLRKKSKHNSCSYRQNI